jgi:hypothetical protein
MHRHLLPTIPLLLFACEDRSITDSTAEDLHAFEVERHALEQIDEGREAFRFDTFGDEAFWGGALRLHEGIAGVSPAAALGLGLKVDVRALPFRLRRELARGNVDLQDPAVTLALLRLDAVVGVTGIFSDGGELTSIGIQCALCHSTVDDSFAPGIGRRLDGWPNRDLDVGQIVNAAPTVQPFADALGVDEATVRLVLQSWGPGRFDAHLILDGQAFRPDGETAAVLIPAAFGLAGVNLATYVGWGSVPYWNAFVGNHEMHGMGRFYDARLLDTARFPLGPPLADVTAPDDRITKKLAALHFYQLAIEAPEPPAGSYDPAAAERGGEIFRGQADCARCHVPPLFTEPGHNLHRPEEIGIDAFQANRGPTGGYRTTPLGGLFARERGGFYHDGRFATLDAVVAHYDGHFGLGLSAEQKADLVQYLRSL